MIVTIKHKGLEKLLRRGDSTGINTQQVDKVKMILELLNNAEELSELRIPSLKLHKLIGNRSNTYSMRINKNWRITFKFVDGDAYEVNMEDYH